jgi:RNA polymerase primary sigma factor
MDPATPLTAAEEQRLALLVREGDRGARNRMVEANVALVAHLARRLRPAGCPIPHSDLVQEGVLGLMQAVERFDPARGHRFSTYAIWWIRGAILRALRDAPPHGNDDALVAELPAEERDPLEGLAREDLAAGMPALLEALPGHSRRVVALRYGLEGSAQHSVAETARELRTSQARVRRMEEHALARLRALPGTQLLAA